MNKFVKVGVAALALAAMQSVRADEAKEAVAEESYGGSPVAIGLATPVQVPWGWNKWDVYGLDLNVFLSQAPVCWGLQIGGLGNMTSRELMGLGIGGLFNWANGDVYGLRTTLGLNYNDGTVYGLELGGVGYHKDVVGCEIECACCIQENITGFNASLIGSYTKNESYGCTMGAFNIADKAYGAQVAFAYNQADELHGCQIGLVNYCRECPWGFQIGVVNIILDNTVKVLPIVNGYF